MTGDQPSMQINPSADTVSAFAPPTTMSAEERPKSIDLSHHLSDVAEARNQSPLKDLAKWMDIPGLVPLGGGSE